MKRILTVQDISCVGKCSLTVALPVISAMGIECAVLPTAVLSSHTAFGHFVSEDLTHTLLPTADAWEAEGLSFDGMYTGYLATTDQLETVCDIAERFCKNAPLLVDPVMGDFGKLYTGFAPGFPAEMKKLCDTADVIVPNLTEACALLGESYREDMREDELRNMLMRLCEGGAKQAVITGYAPKKGEIGVLKYDSYSGKFFSYTAERATLDHPLHGTGDIFASVCAGGLVSGMDIDSALALAVDFVASCVKRTAEDPDSRWYGVNFENMLHMLINR